MDVSYTGIGRFADEFQSSDITGGQKYDTEGVGVNVQMRVVDGISGGYRTEYNSVRNARSFYEDDFGSGENPDFQFVSGHSNRHELYGSFRLPKSFAAIVGYAWSEFENRTKWKVTEYIEVLSKTEVVWIPIGSREVRAHHRTSDRGLTVGVAWSQKLNDRLTLDAGLRSMPQTTYHETYTSTEDRGRAEPVRFSSWSWEPEAALTFELAPRVGVSGGFRTRRFTTPVPGTDTAGHQNSQQIFVGTRLSF